MNNPILSKDELEQYSQQIKLPELGLKGQEKLKNARVLCLGLGGLGSPNLLYLAAAGVGTLGIIDGDNIARSNLHRQILYRLSHLGQSKALQAKEQVLALNPELQVHAYSEKISEKNVAKLVQQYDLIVDASDNFKTAYLVHDQCFTFDKPYVYARATGFQGYCTLFNGQKGPCLHCLFPMVSENDATPIPSCSAGGVLGPAPGILGTMQAAEAIKWIAQIGTSLEKRLIRLDILKMTFTEIQLQKNSNCYFCRH